jgi:hypothetical protein
MTEDWIAVLPIMAVICWGMALKVLTARRPFLYNGNWSLGIVSLAFSPSLITMIMTIEYDLFSYPPWVMVVALVSVLIYAAVLVFFSKMVKGYVAMGVTDDSLRAAIHAALQELEIPFEETLTHIKLTSLELDLQVSVHSWMGTAQFRVKPSKGKSVLKEITKAIVNYYQTHETKMNNTAAIVFFVGGLAVLACTIILIQL